MTTAVCLFLSVRNGVIVVMGVFTSCDRCVVFELSVLILALVTAVVIAPTRGASILFGTVAAVVMLVVVNANICWCDCDDDDDDFF